MAQRAGQPAKASSLLIALLTTIAACENSGELDRGDLLLDGGGSAEAIEAWQRALAKRPNDTRLHIRIATAQSRLGQLDEAEATMLRAVAIEPHSPKVRHNLALVRLKQKRLDKALETFHQVLDLQATYPEANYYIGLIHEMRGDEEAAVKYYVRDVNNGPSPAWERLQVHREKQRELGLCPKGPQPGDVALFCVALLAVAALAYGLRVCLDRRGAEPSSDPGS